MFYAGLLLGFVAGNLTMFLSLYLVHRFDLEPVKEEREEEASHDLLDSEERRLLENHF